MTKSLDLSRVDFEALKKRFEQGKEHRSRKTKRQGQQQVAADGQANKTRTDYQEKLQRLIDEYNSGSST